MARVPEGADLIPTRMSGAPGIRWGNVFILAGVPHITAGMLDHTALTIPLLQGRGAPLQPAGPHCAAAARVFLAGYNPR